MSARDERAAHAVRQSEVKHADRITAVKNGLWRAISGFATQITLNAMSIKDELRYFCKTSYNPSNTLQLRIPPKSTSSFPHAFCVNTPTASEHTLVFFTLCNGAKKHFTYPRPRKMP